MADPVSVTGTAVGIISLGIQVSQGLIEYYSHWKHFDTDVNTMYSSMEQLDRGFRVVGEKLGGGRFAMLPSAHEAEERILLCEGGVMELKRKLEKIKAKEPLENLRSKDHILENLKRQGKRLLYPFQRGTLGKLRDVVNELRDGLNPVFLAVQMDMSNLVLDEVKQVKNLHQKWRLDEEAHKAHAWLSPLIFHKRYQEILSARHPATGLWFLDNKKFLAWRDAAPGVPRGLWCVGQMGSGKSVLLASVIEHLQSLPDRDENALAYVFCDWQEKMSQTEGNVLGAIVQQMTEKFFEIPPVVIQYYKAYKNGKQPPSVQDLYAIFRELAKSFRRVFIIVDGLDELGSGDPVSRRVSMSVMEGTLKTLLERDNEKSPRVRLLISSRFEQQLACDAQDFQKITISAATEELKAFIRSEFGSSSRFVPWINPQLGQRIERDADLLNQVAELCVSRADNTFLLPRLHINHLKQQINLKQLLKAARTLSGDLSRSIRDSLDRIQSQTETVKDVAIRVLYWTLKAMRPLRIDELKHALATDLDVAYADDIDLLDEEFLQDTSDEEELIPQALIVASCAGLVTVNDQTGIVRLIHLSIKQYLEQFEENWFPPIHAAISKVCFVYLSNTEFTKSDSGNESKIKHSLSKYPFLGYSLTHWGYHTCLAPEENVLGHVKNLIACRNRVDFLFCGLFWVLWGTLDPCPHQIPSLFLTSYFGLTATTRDLLVGEENVDDSDFFGRTALYLASALGRTEIVKILLSMNAVVSGRKPAVSSKAATSKAWWLPPWARDDHCSSALCVAAEAGHIEIVQLLIENGAKISAVGGFQDGALEGATFRGHADVARLLLRHGALITRNTLQCSAYYGRVDILDEFLKVLAPRPDPEKISKHAATQDLPKALYAAALAGNTVYAARLLKYGVDPNELTITSYRSPLQAAASRGHIEMIKLLLQHGANVNSEAECKNTYSLHTNRYHNMATPGTALQAAAYTGQIEAVQYLLKEGAKVDLQSGHYGTALQAAAAGSHSDILETLLRWEPDVNLQCGFYGNTLTAAASTGSESLVRALLDAGSAVNAVGGVFGHPLQAAAWSGNPSVIKLLLDAGAEPYKEGGRFSNALQAAAVGCPRKEPDPQLVIPKASSLPLEFQSYTDRGLDSLCLSNMIASQVAGSMRRQASQSLEPDPIAGRTELFPGIEEKILVTNEGEARHETLESPQKSIESVEAVKQLLDVGIDVNKVGGRFYTALQAACYAGHLEVVRLLLDRGADIHTFYEEEDFPGRRYDALSRAIESGHTAIVKHLLERGADPTTSSTKSLTTPLHRAAKQNEDIVRLLLVHGAEINAPDYQGDTPIVAAVRKDKVEMVNFLIQKGADVNQNNHALLSYSIGSGPLDIVRAILKAGASTESINKALRDLFQRYYFFMYGIGWTPHLRDQLQLLLDYGADVNVGITLTDRYANLPEIRAGNVYPPDYTRDLNPLSMVASQFGDEVEVVRMVVDTGADLGKYGHDALWLAKAKGHSRIKEYLVELGVQFGDGEEEELLRALEGVDEENRRHIF